MKKLFLVAAVAATLFACMPKAEVEAQAVLVSGHKAGSFTQDYDAALAYAKAKDLPVFLNFTGSDWCYWCKLMQTNVFSKKEWTAWAKDNLVLVTLDFPNDKTIVPEKYRSRNADLQMAFRVQGYPTYVLLDSDGKTELGRLGAGQDKTVESFTGEMTPLLRRTNAALTGFSKKLTGEALTQYEAKLTALAEAKDTGLAAGVAKAQDALLEAQKSWVEGRMEASDQKAYAEAKGAYQKISDEFDAWLATNPSRSDENDRKYYDLLARFEEQQGVMDGLLKKYGY